MIVTLSDAGSSHNKVMLSLKIGSAGAYFGGLLRLPDLCAQELDTQSL